MGKPAARLFDMTAHGGAIVGPGCMTVLIGKMPAARLTDMHVCPMCNGPVPHAGGPIVGPGCPTVLIGKLPAAVVGDMATCVGPPATILPPGCPTVLIGSSGSSSKGSSAKTAKGARSAKTTKAAKYKTIAGTEAFPPEIQRAFAEAAEYSTPEQVQLDVKVVEEALKQGSGGGTHEGTELTIRDIVEILEAVEREEGFEAARHFASHLDYARLNQMSASGVPDNDPNQMPTRFMLLHGASDSLLRTKDTHPDSFGEGHEVNIRNLRKGLALLGLNVQDGDTYDETVMYALYMYLSWAWVRVLAAPGRYVAKAGDSLGALAARHGMVSWKYLYELNQAAVGDNPDLLAPGTELEIPQWDHTGGDERIAARGAHPSHYTGGLRYAYPWVPFSATLVNRRGEVQTEVDSRGERTERFSTSREVLILDGATGIRLAKGSIESATEVELLVPDSAMKVMYVDGVRYL